MHWHMIPTIKAVCQPRIPASVGLSCNDGLHGGTASLVGGLRCKYTKFCWVGKHVQVRCYCETDKLPNPRPAQPKANPTQEKLD